MIHKKKIFVMLIVCAFVFIGIAAHDPRNNDPHKNLKVLPANISDDSLDMIMDGFKAALGVKCNFCHARQQQDSTKLNFASDDKPEKQIARHMMIMTNDINQKYFNFMGSTQPDTIHVVICATCHRSQPHPEVTGDHMQHDEDHNPPPPMPGQPPPPQH